MKILIVEDDPELAKTIKESLLAKSYTVDVATDGGEGSFLAKNYPYDVIVLDYSLPKKDGLQVCREIRAANKATPIIFLSVNDNLETKVVALESGADDYVVKPVSLEELHARIRAIHRRPPVSPRSLLTVGDIVLDPETHTVTRAGKLIRLTRKEFGVLEYLMRHQGTVVSRMLIMEHVWTADVDLMSNSVETHIGNLRKKLNAEHMPDYISNIAGMGYIMSADPIPKA